MFKRYLAEAERASEAPVTGDDFDFQINETLSIESRVLSHDDDTIVVEADARAMDILSRLGLLSEERRLMRAYDLDFLVHVRDNYYVNIMKHHEDDNYYETYDLLKKVNDTDNRMEKAYEDLGMIHDLPSRRTSEEEIKTAAEAMIGEIEGTATPETPADQEAAEMPEPTEVPPAEEPTSEEPPAEPAASEVPFGEPIPGEEEQEPISPMAEMRRLAGLPPIAETKVIAKKPVKKALIESVQEEESVQEAEYQGHSVQLGKPSAGDVKKYKVFVKDPKSGNVKKVNFGDKNMEIKRDNPERRKNFRARHNCSDKKDRTKAGYWSCRMWSSKPVSKIV